MTTKKPEPQPEYDFRGGVRGKHRRAFQDGTNLRALEPDLVARFPDSESVNEAHRKAQGQRSSKRGNRTGKPVKH